MKILSHTLALGVLASTAFSALFAPKVGVTWNTMLSLLPSEEQANNQDYHVWDFDGLEAPKSLVQTFQAKGHPVICYFSAGTWENWRSDADEFPKSALGKKLGDWPGERWLNISDPKVRDIMVQRIEVFQKKGCDGIDPDNVDGYSNPNGLGLTPEDSVNYLHFLAKEATSRGMSIGLKNAGSYVIKHVIDEMYWSVNEQCAEYHECETFQPFIKQGKPVFHIEYTGKRPAPPKVVKKACDAKGSEGFSTIIKHLNLAQWTTTCPS